MNIISISNLSPLNQKIWFDEPVRIEKIKRCFVCDLEATDEIQIAEEEEDIPGQKQPVCRNHKEIIENA